MQEDLIFDVGLHDGRDTRHYLDSGFRVVGVEANPVLASAAREEFRAELADRRVRVVEAAIGPRAGEVPFWVNTVDTQWSSLDESEATRWGTSARRITVSCMTFESLLAEYGVPYYLKIDIEGASRFCLEALSPPDLPAYVSIEAHTSAYLGMLSRLGYDEFKVIDQRTHLAVERCEPESPWAKRALAVSALGRRAARHLPGARAVYRALATGSREVGRTHAGLGTSGPFAERTAGDWRPLDDVALDYLLFRASSRGNKWCDFHARMSARS